MTIAPTLAADLADTLPYLVEYPYGCVEQTMSRFLPAHPRRADPAAVRPQHASRSSKRSCRRWSRPGQKRLIELQQPDGGWAWQGNGQTHEMMTPYALFGLIAGRGSRLPVPEPEHDSDTGWRG